MKYSSINQTMADLDDESEEETQVPVRQEAPLPDFPQISVHSEAGLELDIEVAPEGEKPDGDQTSLPEASSLDKPLIAKKSEEPRSTPSWQAHIAKVQRLLRRENDHQLMAESPSRYFYSSSLKTVCLLLVVVLLVVAAVVPPLSKVGDSMVFHFQEQIWDVSEISQHSFDFTIYGTLLYNNDEYNACDDPFSNPRLLLSTGYDPVEHSCSFSQEGKEDSGMVQAEFKMMASDLGYLDLKDAQLGFNLSYFIEEHQISKLHLLVQVEDSGLVMKARHLREPQPLPKRTIFNASFSGELHFSPVDHETQISLQPVERILEGQGDQNYMPSLPAFLSYSFSVLRQNQTEKAYIMQVSGADTPTQSFELKDPRRFLISIQSILQPTRIITRYSGFQEFLGTAGGCTYWVQLLASFLFGIYVYKEYTNYMARSILIDRFQKARVDESTTSEGSEEDTRLKKREPNEKEVAKTEERFKQRLSAQGLFDLHDTVAQIDSHSKQNIVALEEQISIETRIRQEAQLEMEATMEHKLLQVEKRLQERYEEEVKRLRRLVNLG